MTHSHNSLVLADGLSIMPRVRPEVIAGAWDHTTAFHALRRAALVLDGTDHEGFPTASLLLTLFGPIPVEAQP